MKALGQFQKAKLLKAKICSTAQGLSTKKRSVSSRRPANSFHSDKRSRKAERSCTPGRSKAICRKISNTPPIHSRWNGRRARDKRPDFLKWTARNSSRSKRRNEK